MGCPVYQFSLVACVGLECYQMLFLVVCRAIVRSLMLCIVPTVLALSGVTSLRLLFGFPFITFYIHAVLYRPCVFRCKSRIISGRPVQDHVTEGQIDIAFYIGSIITYVGLSDFSPDNCVHRLAFRPLFKLITQFPTCTNFSTICIIPPCITFSSGDYRSRSVTRIGFSFSTP